MRFSNNILERISSPGSPTQLAIFRILLGVYIFYISRSRLFDYVHYVYHGRTIKKTVLPQWLDAFTFNYVVEFGYIVTVLAVLFFIGFAYRIVSVLLAVSFLLLYNGVYLAQGTHTQWPYLWFMLLVMMFAPAADCLSADSLLFKSARKRIVNLVNYRWPLELVVLWLSVLYFWAGMAKMLPIWNGWLWLQGGTLKFIIYDRFLYSPAYYIFGKPLFNYAENHQWVFSLLAIASVAIELSGIFLLFTRRFNGLFVVAIILLHGSIYLIGVGDFLLVSLLCCFSLLHPNRFYNIDKSLLKISK